MELKVLVPMASAAHSYRPGQVYTFSDVDEAKRLIEAGFAEPVKGSTKRETTTKETRETR